jgi:hypothetical protein
MRSKAPTPERYLRAAGQFEQVVIEEQGETVSAVRMLDGYVLDALLSRGQIDGAQYEAGDRLYKEYVESGRAGARAINMAKDIVDNPEGDLAADRRIDAGRSYVAAIKALSVKEGMVMQCCVLHGESLEDYGRRIYGHKHAKLAKVAATTVLKDALDILDEHYNGKRSQRTVHGHTTDYRPTEVNPTPKGEAA